MFAGAGDRHREIKAVDVGAQFKVGQGQVGPVGSPEAAPEIGSAHP